MSVAKFQRRAEQLSRAGGGSKTDHEALLVELSRTSGVALDDVRRLFETMPDTRKLARLNFRQGAFGMSNRVMAEGNPAVLVEVLQSIGVLPRPNVGPSVQQNVIVLGARMAPSDILAELAPSSVVPGEVVKVGDGQ